MAAAYVFDFLFVHPSIQRFPSFFSFFRHFSAIFFRRLFLFFCFVETIYSIGGIDGIQSITWKTLWTILMLFPDDASNRSQCQRIAPVGRLAYFQRLCHLFSLNHFPKFSEDCIASEHSLFAWMNEVRRWWWTSISSFFLHFSCPACGMDEHVNRFSYLSTPG